jgi:hypothetical protein
MPRTYPVDRLSYSAVNEFLKNPWRFNRIYVQKINTFTDSPATLVGKAFHKCLELYYGNVGFRTPEGLEDAKRHGLDIIHAVANQIDWGKTGSLEKACADALQTIDHYFLDNPHYEDMGAVIPERAYSGMVKGIPVTIKAISDLTIHTEKEIGIVDFKKVSQISEVMQGKIISSEVAPPHPFAGIPPGYLLQAWFNEKAFYACTTKKVSWMNFHEVKTSKNKKEKDEDVKKPQSQIIRIRFDSAEWRAMDVTITKLVKMVLKEISRKNRVWLPNISDQMAGEESWNEFLSG